MPLITVPSDRWNFIMLVDEFERELHKMDIPAILSPHQVELRREKHTPGRVIEFLMRARFRDSGLHYLEFAYSFPLFDPMLFKLSKKEIHLSLLSFRDSLAANKLIQETSDAGLDLLETMHSQGGLIPLKDRDEAYIARIDPSNTSPYRMVDDGAVLELIERGAAKNNWRLGKRTLELTGSGIAAGRKMAKKAYLDYIKSVKEQ